MLKGTAICSSKQSLVAHLSTTQGRTEAVLLLKPSCDRILPLLASHADLPNMAAGRRRPPWPRCRKGAALGGSAVRRGGRRGCAAMDRRKKPLDVAASSVSGRGRPGGGQGNLRALRSLSLGVKAVCERLGARCVVPAPGPLHRRPRRAWRRLTAPHSPGGP